MHPVARAAAARQADIELAIDTTGSMGGGIDDARADAAAIVSHIQAAVPDTQFAVVQFRDSYDGSYEYQVVQGMTSSSTEVSSALDLLWADGGEDAPEAHNLVFHNSYADTPILPSARAEQAPRHVMPGQAVPRSQPTLTRAFGHRTAAETAGDIGWRATSKKVVIVLSDAQPHGDLATQGFAGCDDVSDDPHGLVTSDELASMSDAGRTLFMVREVDSNVSTSLECYQSLAAATGGGAVDHGGSLADDIVGLLLSDEPASLANSTLKVSDGQPLYVPADGTARTWLSLTLHDASDKPLKLRAFSVKFATPAGVTKAPAKVAAKNAKVTAGSLITDGRGEGEFAISGTRPGPVRMTIIDSDTGQKLAFTQRVEFTRKVVVLAMGMDSYRGGRFCYWGPGGKDHCPSADTVIANTNTVYGALKALKYTPVTDYSSPPKRATVLDVSWVSTPCHGLDIRTFCLAKLSRDTTAQEVRWVQPDYDLRYWPWLKRDKDAQEAIDDYAKLLVNTLIEYDQDLAKVRGIHASFILLGHSMGGELVVRALRGTVTRSYTKARPGLVHTVVAVDGALNWQGWLPTWSDAAKVCSPKKGPLRFGLQTTFNEDREQDNAANVTKAWVLGTTTVAISLAEDQVVPETVAMLESPDTPLAGYVPLLYSMGAQRATTTCGHSILLRSDGKGVTDITPADSSGTEAFPLRTKVLQDKNLVGPAVTEP